MKQDVFDMKYPVPTDEKDQDITGGWTPKHVAKKEEPTLTYYDTAPHYTAAGMKRNIDAIETGVVNGFISWLIISAVLTIIVVALFINGMVS